MRAARRTSASLAPGLPTRMLPATVSSKRVVSWNTMAIWERSDSWVTSRRSVPSASTRPRSGVRKRGTM